MGMTPEKFVDKYYEPSVGDELTIKYEINQGVNASGVGKTKGKIMKIYENGEDAFRGFRMQVIESDHMDLEEDQDRVLDVVSRMGVKGNIDVYYVVSDERRKVNAVPGAVNLVEVNNYSNL